MATLLGALQDAVNLRYNHQLLHDHLRQQQQLWQVVGVVFRQLSQLEYIGKNREGWRTFINENPVATATAPAARTQAPAPTPVPEEPEARPTGIARWNPF